MDDRKAVLAAALLAVTGLAAACNNTVSGPGGPGQTRSITVTGTITELTGAPAANAFVTVTPFGPTQAVSGVSDATGRFSLGPVTVFQGETVQLAITLADHVTRTFAVPTSGASVDVTIPLAPLHDLAMDAATNGVLDVNDPPTYVGTPYDSDYLQNTEYFAFATPATDDVIVDLTFTASGNAALEMYALEGTIPSTASGSSISIRLPKGTTGTLLVGQAYSADKLTTPVPFTLNAHRAMSVR